MGRRPSSSGKVERADRHAPARAVARRRYDRPLHPSRLAEINGKNGLVGRILCVIDAAGP
jgi:hypothetical protein